MGLINSKSEVKFDRSDVLFDDADDSSSCGQIMLISRAL